jgi:hypothetical protein
MLAARAMRDVNLVLTLMLQDHRSDPYGPKSVSAALATSGRGLSGTWTREEQHETAGKGVYTGMTLIEQKMHPSRIGRNHAFASGGWPRVRPGGRWWLNS